MGTFLLMFILLIFFLALGIPVAFSITATSLVVLASIRGIENLPLEMIAQRMLYGVNNFTLLAIPSFLLIGKLMNAAGITDRMFNVARALFGHFRGGLGHVNIIASIIFAGMSGSAVADAGGLGAVEIKAMEDDGYPTEFCAAVTAASATIGPIIPPSIPAVIYGALANVSIGAVFLGSIIPGFMMAAGMMVLIVILSHINHYPVHPRAKFLQLSRAIQRGFLPLLTPIIIVGGILSGVFTPTEAAGIALFYAVVISFFVYRSISFQEFKVILKETMVDSAVLLFIIAGSSLYSWVLARYQVTHSFIDFLTINVKSPIVLLLLINIFLLLIGCFIDSVPALFLLTPILVPLVKTYGIDPVHFGVVVILNLMIGLISPPVGTVLYTLQKVTGVQMDKLFKHVLPFYVPLFVVLLLITYVPWLVTFIPNIFLK